MNLLQFPTEILQHILSFLSVKDLLSASESCKTLFEASNIDFVWYRRCSRDFNIEFSEGTLFFKLLYQKVLYPYRHLLGLWQADIVAYGGLFLVKCTKDGIEGCELCAPRDPHIKDPLRAKTLFRICLPSSMSESESPDLEAVCPCLGQPNAQHKNHLASVELTGPNTFEFKCSCPDTHLNPSGRQQDFLNWLREEQGGPNPALRAAAAAGPFLYNEELLLMKFLSLRHHSYQYRFNRLDLSPRRRLFGSGVEPILPGLFSGTYGAHGLEIINLTYEVSLEGEPKAKALKITGDPNVPAGEVTFHVNLNYPINSLPEEEQRTISQLEALQLLEVPYLGHPCEMPFVVPVDCFERFQGVPTICTHRFHGWGQIAGHGFTNPSFSKGHWVIFNEDLFGFLWLELLSLSMYHRIKDLDP